MWLTPYGDTLKPTVEYGMLDVQQRQNLSGAASRLLNYIERHPNAVLVSSALDLAAKIDASDATVIRSIQALGFDGLPHLKTVIAEKLDEGTRTPVEKVGVTVSELTQDRTRPPLQLVIEAYARTLEKLSHPTLAEDFEAAAKLLNDASRVGLFGGGPLSRLAQQTATHLGRIGRTAFVMEGTGHAFADALLCLQPGDAVILLAYGKVHKESLLIKEELQRVGGKLVVITDNPAGRLAKGAQAVLETPRTEVGNMTFYGTILLALETLVLSLTQLGPERAMETARRLRDFREELDHGH
ncbi:MurR/RpiR family transcriptional regulator [Phyllobacterium sp. 22229]|uniref:MurR/RpiR family transcriptional regulator n=1 Tax=Agrobacterium radiobacter TaxID=362 RepID=A0ABD5LPK4_AGRRD